MLMLTPENVPVKEKNLLHKNENSVYIPNYKEGLSPHEDVVIQDLQHDAQQKHLISQLIRICTHSAKQLETRKGSHEFY